jgi:hypothetical protein
MIGLLMGRNGSMSIFSRLVGVTGVLGALAIGAGAGC